MKPAVTYNGKPLDETYNGELDYMVDDTLNQLETIRNNETIEPDSDEFGVDGATD